MAPNFPGPYELEITYDVISLTHKLRHSLGMGTIPASGSPFSSWITTPKSGAAVDLQTWTDGLIAVTAPLYRADASFSLAELYEYDPLTFDRTWRASYTLATVGAVAGATQPAHQSIFTFRTAEGGIQKMVLMEEASTTYGTYVYAGLGASGQAFVDYCLGASSPILGRDTSFITSFIRRSDGQNEATWRQRYRN